MKSFNEHPLITVILIATLLAASARDIECYVSERLGQPLSPGGCGLIRASFMR